MRFVIKTLSFNKTRHRLGTFPAKSKFLAVKLLCIGGMFVAPFASAQQASLYRAQYQLVDANLIDPANGGSFSVPYVLDFGEQVPGLGDSFEVNYTLSALTGAHLWDVRVDALPASIHFGIINTHNPVTSTSGTLSIGSIPMPDPSSGFVFAGDERLYVFRIPNYHPLDYKGFWKADTENSIIGGDHFQTKEFHYDFVEPGGPNGIGPSETWGMQNASSAIVFRQISEPLGVSEFSRIPEPSGALLLVLGFAMSAFQRRR